MRSRTVLVHVCLTDVAIQVALLKDLHHIVWVFDDESGEIFHVDTGILVVQLQPTLQPFLVQ